MLLEKISEKELTDYDNFVQSPLFEEIFQLARKIDDIAKYGNSIGNNCYTALINTSLPVVIFSNDYDDKEKKESIVTHMYKIQDFLGIKNQVDELHMDYGIIYSGMNNKIEHIHHIFDNTEAELAQVEKSVLQWMKDAKIRDPKKLPFGNIFDRHFLPVLEDAYAVINIKLLYMFSILLQKGVDEEVISKFIHTVEDNSHIGMLFEKMNDLFVKSKFWFDHYKKFEEENIAFFPINTTKT